MIRLLAIMALTSCIQSGVTVCSDGRVCPTAAVCDDTHHLCVTRSQLTSCAGLDDKAPCPLDDQREGECRDAVCIEQVCGDGLVTGTEDCDTTTDKSCTTLGYYDDVPLTCSKRCAFDIGACTGKCGDGMINGAPGVEVCDGAPPPGTACIDYGFEWGRLGCTKFCGPAFDACKDIGFLPPFQIDGNHAFSVWGIAPGHYLIGRDTAITEVNGTTVTSTTLPFQGEVASIWGTGPTDIFAAYGVGRIAHFDGTTWTSTTIGTSLLYAIWGSGPTDVYAAGYNYSLYHFSGTQWSQVTVPANGYTAGFRGIWGTGPNNVLVMGDVGRLFRFDGTWHDDDVSACWGSGSPVSFAAVWGSAANDIFAVGGAGEICHFDGSVWSAQPSPVSTALRSIWGRSSTDIFAVGVDGVVVHYDGAGWWPLDSGTQLQLLGVGGVGGDLVVAGEFGVVRRYVGAAFVVQPSDLYNVTDLTTASAKATYMTNGGALYRRDGGQWSIFGDSPNDLYQCMWADPSGAGVFAEEDLANTVHHFDGVATWTQTTLPFGALGLAGRTPSDVFAVGGAGGVEHFNGTAWSAQTSNTTATLVDVGVGPTTTYAAGSAPIVIRYDGTSWTEIPLPVGTPGLTSIYVAGDNDVFVAGGEGAILHYDGSSWTTFATGYTATLTRIRGTSATDVFAIGGGGVVLHYDGIAWSPVAARGGNQYTALAVRSDFVLAMDPVGPVLGLVRSSSW